MAKLINRLEEGKEAVQKKSSQFLMETI